MSNDSDGELVVRAETVALYSEETFPTHTNEYETGDQEGDEGQVAQSGARRRSTAERAAAERDAAALGVSRLTAAMDALGLAAAKAGVDDLAQLAESLTDELGDADEDLDDDIADDGLPQPRRKKPVAAARDDLADELADEEPDFFAEGTFVGPNADKNDDGDVDDDDDELLAAPPAEAELDLPAVSRKVSKPRIRTRRNRPRSKTIALKRLTREELRKGALANPPVEGVARPTNRSECKDGPRPCPWVACKHHLYLDINPRTGSIKINFPDLEPWELAQTCALDVADNGGLTLEEIGLITNLTRERVRQVEVRGLLTLRSRSSTLR